MSQQRRTVQEWVPQRHARKLRRRTSTARNETFQVAGIRSSCSQASSPKYRSTPPHVGHAGSDPDPGFCRLLLYSGLLHS
jgi:hypothetical protein